MPVHRYNAQSGSWPSAYTVDDGTGSVIYAYSGGGWQKINDIQVFYDGAWHSIYTLSTPPPPPTEFPIILWRSTYRMLKNISPMMRGSDVLTVQTLVWKMYGFSVGPMGLDSIYGPYTTSGVRAFQHATGLVVDGIVGPKTTSMLYGMRI